MGINATDCVFVCKFVCFLNIWQVLKLEDKAMSQVLSVPSVLVTVQ